MPYRRRYYYVNPPLAVQAYLLIASQLKNAGVLYREHIKNNGNNRNVTLRGGSEAS